MYIYIYLVVHEATENISRQIAFVENIQSITRIQAKMCGFLSYS